MSHDFSLSVNSKLRLVAQTFIYLNRMSLITTSPEIIANRSLNREVSFFDKELSFYQATDKEALETWHRETTIRAALLKDDASYQKGFLAYQKFIFDNVSSEAPKEFIDAVFQFYDSTLSCINKYTDAQDKIQMANLLLKKFPSATQKFLNDDLNIMFISAAAKNQNCKEIAFDMAKF